MDKKNNIEPKKDDPLYKALMTQEMLKKIEKQVESNNTNLIKVIEQFSKENPEKGSKKE
jgi:hypothetical protein